MIAIRSFTTMLCVALALIGTLSFASARTIVRKGGYVHAHTYVHPLTGKVIHVKGHYRRATVAHVR